MAAHKGRDSTQPKPTAQHGTRPLREWLARAAELYGDRIALEAESGSLTYRALQGEVLQLAQQLRAAGATAGDRIGIAAVRDLQSIVSLLAVVDAGAAYVPLDLAYPADRLSHMLRSARPRLVLGTAQALAQLEALVGPVPHISSPAAREEAPFGAHNDLTYVLFTSGSTGLPKGVAMGAAPLCNLTQWHSEHVRLGVAARTLQFAPLSFDVHFQEIFSTIACGGTLVIVGDEVRRDPARLHAALIDKKIERVFVPYVALQMIAQASQDQVPISLREVVSAGEQLQVTPAIRSMFGRLPGAQLHNHYGPTESHVVTAHELTGNASEWPEIPPIGKALPYVQLALRDVETGAVHHGDSSELLLGGACLAHGYLGQPALSAERFVDSINALPGRWYTSGDLVRRDAAGIYTYLGRADQQLKVDGFRIEPGEIELAIMAHESVLDAVVTAPELPGIGKQLVAYLVFRDNVANRDAALTQLRTELREKLPAYMVPARYTVLDKLPTTPSGKIDRRALPLPTAETLASGTKDVRLQVEQLWQDLLGVATIGDSENLFDLGARSLLVMRFVARMKDLGHSQLSVADVYDRPTVAGIASAIEGSASTQASRSKRMQSATAGIAIVGSATRTAGAKTPDQFWANLLAGREGIRHFSPDELDASVPDDVKSRPNFVAARGVIEDPDRFDAAFFGISAREATMLDPQQRIFLELCWSAIENAAIDPARAALRIGVYAGTANNTYAPALRLEQPELVRQYGEFATMLASEKDYVATRAANRLNLNGPAVSIHTACSTGLVAVCQAWHALASGQCDAALAGGVTVMVPQESGYLHVEGSMESADGHCRPFDADASGTVFASGGAVVVLKRIEDAQRDGDTIYAVIRGVGLNNDGADKASFTAPSVSGQAAAIRMALDHAQLNARSISYVEAHGTGTSLGDPIEIAGLTRAWRADTPDNQFCAIGSVKGNLGHTIAAAGVLGLIKAALALHHELIPATLHFKRANPQISFESTPFTVCAANQPWPRAEQPRRAAVSSFGVGGTNAHVIIEEAPVDQTARDPNGLGLQVLPLSARTPELTLQRARDLADHLERNPSLSLASVAATLMRGRKDMGNRCAVAASDSVGAITALRALKSPATALAKPRVVFLFPGQGSQHPGMARELVEQAPAFREALHECLSAMPAELSAKLNAWLVKTDPRNAEIAEQLAETRHSQPALFSVSYALGVWLSTLGIKANALIGHSIGEYAAACLAGVLNVNDAVAAVVARGQAMFQQQRGAMLAVRASASAVTELLPSGVEVAGCNAPALTVVAGSFDAIDAFAKKLEAQDIGTTRLKVSHAFHSASMDGALPAVKAALSQLALKAPNLKLYSCVSGAPLKADEALDPGYWANQVRAPVQFNRAVQTELDQGETVFVEVGPGQALTALLRQQRTQAGIVPKVVPLLGAANDPGQPAHNAFNAVGALWASGVQVQWPVPAHAQRVPLPTYPFNGERYWFTRSARPHTVATQSINQVSTQVVAHMSRIPRIEQELKRILSDVSGMPGEEMATDATFVDQGLDSLSLTQATLELERVFGIKLRFRRLLEDLNSVEKLSQFLDSELPAEKFAAPIVTSPPATAVAAPAAQNLATAAPAFLPAVAHTFPATDTGTLHSLISQQMQLMSQQLALLSGQPAAVQIVTPMVAKALPTTVPTAFVPPQAAGTTESAATTQPDKKALLEKPFGASARITLNATQDFSPQQRTWLDEFVSRYVARSGKSKIFSQKNRKVMADPRVVTGFNPLWKDLVYPIVVDRSQGSRLWDIDGNEYIDLLSCFGANLLGYQQPEVIQAMAEQLQRGLEVGPQHPLSAEVAQLISEFTGMERVAFCNTGSEAVMGAMRIARTVTGRKTIAIFTNSYHGIFDEVIVRGTKQLRSLSAAPGILANAVENILVLDWASEDSLRILRERGTELAAIMTEPIQNKYPTQQPREFVKSLRQIADDSGCALIFDEVVTGFRVAPGGAQEFYGVRADIATYGKIIGGGLPFAAIGGGERWLDALDGGHWQYGDDSYPEAGVTYFAGTFVRHPLALAAAKAALLHLKRGGRALYRTLNDRTQNLIDRLNTAFAVRGAPVKAVHCASLWRLQWDDGQRYISFFYYLLRFHGLHVYEQFGHFVTEAMSEQDTDRIFDVFTKSLDELMALGFITPRDGTPPATPITGSGGALTSGKAVVTSGSAASGNLRAQTEASPEGTLSPGQSERWLAAAFDPAARRALNESFYILLRGVVNTDALKASVHDVVARHEAFRITFDSTEPLQRVTGSGQAAVKEVDLRNEKNAGAALEEFCKEASRRDFAIDVAPLAAFSLLYLSDGSVAVHVVASHLIFDGWASSVFNAELATAYRARAGGTAPDFLSAESAVSFAAQEQQRFESPEGQEALQYWTKLLSNPPAQLNLGDRKPTPPRAYAADTEHVRIDGPIVAQLRARARSSGATLFQLLLSAVSIMLHRQSGSTDFIVSVPYASQSFESHGPLIADGVLDLPLRMHCSPEETSGQLLSRVRSQLMDALDQPIVTQGTVARALGIRSSGDRPALTGIFFNLNPRVDVSGFAPLSATMKEGHKQGTLHDLFFNFYDQGDALTLDLHYSADFFSASRAAELVRALQGVCLALAQQLDVQIKGIELDKFPSPSASLDPRLLEWNATDFAVEALARVDLWVGRQASATPNAVAIETATGQLTYSALEARANRFAHLLHARGIGPGTLVGLCLSRGLELMPALLGILKTGAAYVPLDPGFPKDRLQYMADDAAVKLVITEAAHADKSGVSRERQLRIDDDAALITAAVDQPFVPSTAWPHDAPAYVIYTSGSTGKPKGVVLPQNAVCNFLASMAREPGLKENDRLLAVTTLSFDIAVLELMLPLTVGARIVIAQRDDAMDGEVLGHMIAHHQINVMQATPTTWHMLLDAGWRAPKGFKALCGGEPLPPSLAVQLLDQGIELWNMYGPTETTVWSTLARISDGKQKITIGKPIGNTQVWILDDKLNPCPVGAEGEICIGGSGVATGYFKRPELTAERFVPDPFDSKRKRRIYRTGDLGRWREDGTIEHLGRLDYQVKIRGYRIELGEIEAQLAAQPGIARTVVVAREDSPGDVRLIGYAVAQTGQAPEPTKLRDALRAALPDYMLPHQIILLDAMPLLPNGKIDRKTLPAPTVQPAVARQDVEPPRNDMERVVSDAMRTVLKLQSVGRQDDFFSLGGHSLLAAKLIGQINKQLGLQLNLRALFESPSVEKFALVIEQHQKGASPQIQRAPILPREDQSSAPLTLMQERIRFMEEMQPGRVVYNAPSAHRLTGPMDVKAFDRAFIELVRRQLALQSAIGATQSGWVQKLKTECLHSLLPAEDLSAMAPAQREAVLEQRLEALTAQTFNLENGPLFKARLFKLADDEHALFFMPHHIIWDGWSFDIFYTEMSALYQAYVDNKKPALAPLPVTYGDFATWHKHWLQTQEIQDQVRYWKAQFANSPLPTEAPTDLPRKKESAGHGATEWMHIPSDLAERVRDIAKRTGSTLSIVTLSVYSALIAEFLRDSRPSIGIPVRGRPTAELESIMGFFNNLLPVRVDASDTSVSCIEWVRKIRQTVVDGFAHQDVPFELLAHELEIHRGGASSKLYQVMFSFQDARARPTSWGPLQHERIRLQQKGATEDLNLWLVEIPDGIEGGVQYNSELFLPSTAAALRDRFMQLLERLVSNPEQSVKQLLSLSDSDRAAIEVLAIRPDAMNLERSFALKLDKHFGKRTSNAALRADLYAMSYKQLGEAISSIDRALNKHSVSSAGTVAIAARDPLLKILCAIAVLHRGGKFVVISPDHSAHQSELSLNSQLGITTIFVDSPVATASKVGLAYIDILQTSGLSGLPTISQSADSALTESFSSDAVDGAMMEEALQTIQEKFSLLEGDSALCFTDRAFGQQVTEACLALSAGATLVLSSQTSAAEFSTLSQSHQFSLVGASAKTWQAVLSATSGSEFSGTALIEVAHASQGLLVKLFARGATALAVLRTSERVLPVAVSWMASQQDIRLAGVPCTSQSIKICNTAGELVPIGVPGILYVRTQADWKKTDVSCRWRSDGVLQYLGDIPEFDSASEPAASASLQGHTAEAQGNQYTQSRYTETQKIMIDVWGKILGVSDIRLQDNFFELGGTSLMAMQASLQLEQRLKRRIFARRYVFESLGQLSAAYDLQDNEAPIAPADLRAMAGPVIAKSSGRGVRQTLARWMGRN